MIVMIMHFNNWYVKQFYVHNQYLVDGDVYHHNKIVLAIIIVHRIRHRRSIIFSNNEDYHFVDQLILLVLVAAIIYYVHSTSLLSEPSPRDSVNEIACLALPYRGIRVCVVQSMNIIICHTHLAGGGS